MLTSPGWRGPTSRGSTLLSFTVGLVLGAEVTALATWVIGGLVRPVVGGHGGVDGDEARHRAHQHHDEDGAGGHQQAGSDGEPPGTRTGLHAHTLP